MIGRKVLFFRKNYPNYYILDWDPVTIIGAPSDSSLIEVEWEDKSRAPVAVYALLPDTTANRRKLQELHARSRKIYEDQRKLMGTIDNMFGYHLPEAKEWAKKKAKK